VVTEELLKYQYLIMKKRERNSGKIVKKSMWSNENFSCEIELCKKVDMALSFPSDISLGVMICLCSSSDIFLSYILW
jgi:hypothetical protein